MTRLLLRPIGVAIWFGGLLAAGLFFGLADPFFPAEQALLNERFRALPKEARKFPSDIVLVEVNNDSIHARQRIPWDEAKLATLIKKLRENSPKTIVVTLPLLSGLSPTQKSRVKKLLDEYSKLHPEPQSAKPDDKKKKKKRRRRRRRLSRRQQAELAKKKAMQKKIEALRKLLKEAAEDPSHKQLLEEIKKTKNLVLSYTYHMGKEDILGVDGVYFNKKTKAKKPGAPPKDAKKNKKDKKAKKKAPAGEVLFTLDRQQAVAGTPGEPPGRLAAFLRENPEFAPFAKYHGFTNINKKSGEVLYKMPLVVRKGGKLYPSIGLAAYIAYKNKNPLLLTGSNGFVGIDLQGTTLPLTDKGDFWLNYYGPKGPKTRLLAGDIIEGKGFTKGDLENKLVFVGLSSTPKAREYLTPYGKLASATALHATAAANLLKGESLTRGNVFVELGILLGLALLFGILSMGMRYFAGLILVIVMIVGLHYVNELVLFPGGTWYQFLYIQAALISLYIVTSLTRLFSEDVTRQITRSRFQPRMGKEDFEVVLKNPNAIQMEGNWRPLTVLSGQCLPLGQHLNEEHDPKQIAKHLSHLLSPMAEAVCRNRGTIAYLEGHDFQGFFNAPFSLAEHAEKACSAALQMRSDCEPFQHQWDLEGLPKPIFAAGLDTGDAIAGNFGGTERFLYSVAGAPVEMSAQLRQLNTHYQSQILLSDAMYQQIKESGRFIVRELDWVRWKDDQAPIPLYELLGEAPASSPINEAVEWYQHGLSYYRARNFQEAVRYFQEILRVRPDDGPARTMLERSQHYLHYPPSFQWDGAWKLK